LATYLVEGKTSKEYLEIKKMAFNEPALLHQILKSLADSIAEYALFQIENGAQLIQIFDSWAGHLSARDYDEFAAPYQKIILDKVSFIFNIIYKTLPPANRLLDHASYCTLITHTLTV
jgi:uroporphyrinogen decarboxylase